MTYKFEITFFGIRCDEENISFSSHLEADNKEDAFKKFKKKLAAKGYSFIKGNVKPFYLAKAIHQETADYAAYCKDTFVPNNWDGSNVEDNDAEISKQKELIGQEGYLQKCVSTAFELGSKSTYSSKLTEVNRTIQYHILYSFNDFIEKYYEKWILGWDLSALENIQETKSYPYPDDLICLVKVNEN